jgi:hypothetical protein
MDERKLTYLVRQELDRSVRTISPELDKRLARKLGRNIATESQFRPFYLRPALAFAVLAAFAFTTGSLLSKQTLDASEARAEGPAVVNDFSKNFSQPTLVNPIETNEAAAPQTMTAIDVAKRYGVPHSVSQPSFIAISNEPAELTRANAALSMDPVSRFGFLGSTHATSEPMNVASTPAIPGALLLSAPIENKENFDLNTIFDQSEKSSEARSLGYQVQDRQQNFYISRERAGAVYQVLPGGRLKPVIEGLSRPRGLAFDQAGNLYIVESGTGRLWRMENLNGTLSPNSSKVFAENFASTDRAELSDLVINGNGDLFVSATMANQASVVYQISTKQPTAWWKFFCWYRC